ncbi:MAG: GGDEF domain-containing protein [Caldimonas sp.]
MPVHPPSLLAAVAAALFLASAASASIGLRQRARRGMWWWMSANVLLVVALVWRAFADIHGLDVPIDAVFALQWPILTLAGVRHFYSRGANVVPAWADWLILTMAVLSTVGTWIAPFEFATPAQVFAAAALVVTLYTAVAVARLEDFATTSTLRTLVFGLVASAVAQGAWLAALAIDVALPGIAAADSGLAAMLAPALIALLMTQLALVMNHERHIDHLRASQRKLRQLVDVDDLTRLPNRRHFHELAERAVKVAPEAATVLVFDVDRLRRVNELLGHATGDEALRQIGTALRETLRRRDVAGRLGGDEFAVILPRTKVTDSANVVARINARIDDRQVAPRIARVSLNVGSTQMLAGESIADALRRAELALEAMRDDMRRRLAEQLATPAVDGPTLLAANLARAAAAQPRDSQLSALNAIPVGEVVGATP